MIKNYVSYFISFIFKTSTIPKNEISHDFYLFLFFSMKSLTILESLMKHTFPLYFQKTRSDEEMKLLCPLIYFSVFFFFLNSCGFDFFGGFFMRGGIFQGIRDLFLTIYFLVLIYRVFFY